MLIRTHSSAIIAPFSKPRGAIDPSRKAFRMKRAFLLGIALSLLPLTAVAISWDLLSSGVMVGISGGVEIVQKTYDGGVNWEIKHSGPVNHTLQGVDFQGDSGIAVGSGGRILISDDAGETWTLDSVTSPATTLMAASIEDGAAYAAGTSGRIFRRGDLTAVPGAQDPGMLPRLLPNYPNPFNPSTTIHLQLARSGNVSLTLYDCGGREVAQVFEGHLPAGMQRITLEADGLSSGVCIARLSVDGQTRSKKIVLMK